MITASGREHFLSGPELLMGELDINDAAWSLAQINRYTGHARRPYSVAEHSILTQELAARDGRSALIQLLCLTHDIHESATGDVSSPAKVAVGLAWSEFEARQADIFRRRLGLHAAFGVHRKLVGQYDLVALATEREQLTSYDPARNRIWPILDTPGAEIHPAREINLNSLERLHRPWTEWRAEFLARFHALWRAFHEQSTSLQIIANQEHA